MIFTENAAKRVQEIILEDTGTHFENGESPPQALRLFVQGGGCHGFSYGFEANYSLFKNEIGMFFTASSK